MPFLPMRTASVLAAGFVMTSLQAPTGYAYRVLIEWPRPERCTLLTTTSQPTCARQSRGDGRHPYCRKIPQMGIL